MDLQITYTPSELLDVSIYLAGGSGGGWGRGTMSMRLYLSNMHHKMSLFFSPRVFVSKADRKEYRLSGNFFLLYTFGGSLCLSPISFF